MLQTTYVNWFGNLDEIATFLERWEVKFPPIQMKNTNDP